jgi:hypothetical protein
VNTQMSDGALRLICTAAAVLVLVVLGVVANAALSQAASDAEFNTTLGHFAAFSDSVERSQVDVRIDGQQIASSLAYLEQVQNLTLEIGTHEIVISPLEWVGGTITETFELPVPGTNGLVDPGVLLAINAGTSGIPLGVMVQAIEQMPPSDGAQIRLTNLALYAVNGESEYTLCNADGTPFYNLEMVRFGESSDYVVIPAGTYRVYLAGTFMGCTDPLTPELLLTFADASVADLYAVGTNASSAFPNTLTVVSANAIVKRPVAYMPVILN